MKKIIFVSTLILFYNHLCAQNVGIGTTTPQSKLQVAGQIKADSILIDAAQFATNLFTVRNFAAGIDQQQAVPGAIENNNAIARWQSFTSGVNGSLSNFEFYWNNTLVTNQNVRIYDGEGTGGTILFSANVNTTPVFFGGYPFTNVAVTGVTLNAASKYTIWISNGSQWQGSFSNLYAGGISSAAAFPTFDHAFKTYTAGNVNSLVVNNAGNVGIGTITPTAKLDVAGDAKVSGLLNVGTFSATSLVVNNAGNVGIGTITPTAKLDVVGDVKVSGLLNVGTFSATNLNGSVLNIGGLATQSLTANGYAKIGGLLLQWGSGNYSSNIDVLVNFPIAFTNVFSINAIVESGSGAPSGSNIPCKVSSLTNGSFIYAGTQLFTGDASSKVRWIAIGN